MDQEIPKIPFAENRRNQIEVMNFTQLSDNLSTVTNHDPFTAHKIEFHLILIVTKNVYTHFIDFKSYKVDAGTAIFVAKNQVHHFSHDIKKADGFGIVIKSQFMDRFNFISDNIKLNRLFNYHIDSPIISATDMGDDSFLDIATLLHKEYSYQNDFAKSEMLRTVLQVLLLRAERSKEACSNTTIKPYWFEVFSNFKNLLELEYVDTRNARAYAKKLLVSYKFLNDVVKKLTNKTAKSFIDQFVTIEIKRYLASTSLSINEIAYKTGFLEPANMIKFFKRNAHTTPLKFRQEL